MATVLSRVPLSIRRLFRRPLDSDPVASGALLLVRLIAGTAMTLHGLPKLADPMSWMGPSGVPGVLQLLAACAEVVGGLAWILGAATPLAALAVGATMIVAVVIGHVAVGDPLIRLTVHWLTSEAGDPFAGLPTWLVRAGGRSAIGSGSSELALLFLSLSAVLFSVGPGRYSLDALLAGRLDARERADR